MLLWTASMLLRTASMLLRSATGLLRTSSRLLRTASILLWTASILLRSSSVLLRSRSPSRGSAVLRHRAGGRSTRRPFTRAVLGPRCRLLLTPTRPSSERPPPPGTVRERARHRPRAFQQYKRRARRPGHRSGGGGGVALERQNKAPALPQRGRVRVAGASWEAGASERNLRSLHGFFHWPGMANPESVPPRPPSAHLDPGSPRPGRAGPRAAHSARRARRGSLRARYGAQLLGPAWPSRGASPDPPRRCRPVTGPRGRPPASPAPTSPAPGVTGPRRHQPRRHPPPASLDPRHQWTPASPASTGKKRTSAPLARERGERRAPRRGGKPDEPSRAAP